MAKTTIYEKKADGSLFPLGQVVPNIDERVRQLEQFPGAVVVSVPQTSSNLRLPIGQTSEIIVTANSLLVGGKITKFKASVDDGDPQEIVASDNQGTVTVTIPPETPEDTGFKLKVTAYDELNSFNSNTFTITAINIGVTTPIISGKTTDVVKGEASFSGSEFQVIGAEGNHDKSDWVLYKKDAPEIEVWSSKEDTSNLTTCPTEINDHLESGLQYILKLRYHDSTNNLWSEYGSLEFTMATIAVRTPTLQGTTEGVIKTQASFTGSSFELIGAAESNHDKSDWVMVNAAYPSSEIWSSKNDSVNKTKSPDSLNDSLVESTTYILKVRYHDAVNDIWSDWGEIQFTTAEQFLGPTCPVVFTQGIHFKASKQGSSINFFKEIAPSGCKYEVWINGEKTAQDYKSISFNVNDDILIKCVAGDKFPWFTGNDTSSGPNAKDYFKEILEPLPLLSTNTGSSVTNFSSCFQSCTSLTSIPENLFANNTSVTNFSSCFQSCTSLTSIPENLFANNTSVTRFNRCLASCSSLTSIPENLFANNTSVTDFNYCLASCSSLTSIPENLFANNTSVTGFNSCLEGCSSLTSIPENLFANNTSVTDFNYCLASCSSLTPIVRIKSTNVYSSGYFANGCKAKGTVYVPRSSTTASTFRSATTPNVNVIEE